MRAGWQDERVELAASAPDFQGEERDWKFPHSPVVNDAINHADIVTPTEIPPEGHPKAGGSSLRVGRIGCPAQAAAWVCLAPLRDAFAREDQARSRGQSPLQDPENPRGDLI